jgi:6-pyruvoyltetrahydropterin/6-carboxytetrahydropterin synthase
MPVTTLSILFEFSASHRLYRPELSDGDNFALFGKCSNPNGHGHNYTLEVRVAGPVEPPGEMVVDASRVKALVEESILVDVDHKDLNKDTPWLKGQVPTTEVVANAIFARLAGAISSMSSSAVLESVTLHETRRISVTVKRGC